MNDCGLTLNIIISVTVYVKFEDDNLLDSQVSLQVKQVDNNCLKDYLEDKLYQYFLNLFDIKSLSTNECLFNIYKD